MLYRLSVWLHIIGACVWVGGILFFALVLVPALRRPNSPVSTEVVGVLGKRFRIVGWWSVALLVATGFVNLSSRVAIRDWARADFWSSPFGFTLGIKLSFVFAIVLVSIAHDLLGLRATEAAIRDPRSREAGRLRVTASMLGRLDAVLALVVVYLGVVLVRGW